MKQTMGKILRIVAIVFMGLTAAMNILGGIGTVCAAFLTEQFESMLPLLPYRWLYQIVMLLTIALGVAGVWVTIKLVRGGGKAYRNAVILLAAGTLVGAVQVMASLALRGKAVPANMKLYLNALTLVLFLLLGLPGVRDWVGLTKPGEARAQAGAAGLTAMLAGALVLTTSLWVGNSHTVEGVDWVMVLHAPLTGSGLALLGIGLSAFGASMWRRRAVRRPLAEVRSCGG